MIKELNCTKNTTDTYRKIFYLTLFYLTVLSAQVKLFRFGSATKRRFFFLCYGCVHLCCPVFEDALEFAFNFFVGKMSGDTDKAKISDNQVQLCNMYLY